MMDESSVLSMLRLPGRQRGSVGVAFAVLLSLLALGAAGYILYRDVYLDPFAELAAGLQSVREESAAQRAQLETTLDAVESRLLGELAAQQDRIGAFEAVVGRLQLEAAGRKPDELAWRLVEAEYLLRIADHRGRMDGDADGARALLVAAEKVLADADDRATAEIRQAVAEGIRLLDAAPKLDVRGIYRELEDIQDHIDDLPFRLPEFASETPAESLETPAAMGAAPSEVAEGAMDTVDVAADGESPGNAWQRTLGRIGSLFDFRRRDSTAPRPVLSPDEERFLQMNLALATEEAQVALMARDADLFDASLRTILESISRYMDTADARVIEVRQRIEQIRMIAIDAPLPDFSRALVLLQRRGDAAAESAAPAVTEAATVDEMEGAAEEVPVTAAETVAREVEEIRPGVSSPGERAPAEPELTEAQPVATDGEATP